MLFIFLLVLIRKTDATHGRLLSLEQAQNVVVVHVVLFKNLFGSVVYLIVQDGQQQVLLIHTLLSLDACFKHGQLQDVRCPFVQHQLMGVDGLRNVILSHFRLQVVFQLGDVQSQTVEHINDRPVLHAQQS